MPFRVFDLHCDTLSRCLDTKELLFQNSGQLDGARICGTNAPWVQTFACFIESGCRGEAAFQRFLSMQRLLCETLESDPFALYSPGKEPKPAQCTAVLSVEGGTAIGGNICNIEAMADLGVRFFTLVWNGDNELAHGTGGEEKGLTPFGKDCLKELLRVGIVPDISHLNDFGIDDVFSQTDAPVIATHSNLRAVCDHPRNLTDAQFKELVRRRGLCGLNFYPLFVTGEKHDPYAYDALRRHLDRMLFLGGERIVALGSDFDGIDCPLELEHAGHMDRLICALEQGGFTPRQIERVCWQNAWDFYERTL
mgnify:CR=1 FL=1